ncbi:MAG: carboxylesterase family protein, partial [bacterium]|nr:carboxylesterase family protein [Candidatus Colisoma equi]
MTPAQNGDNPSAWKDRIVEVKDADINPCPDRPNCYEVVFSLESKVANTNVWVDFTAYSEDNFPFFIGDSISFDSCQSYTNEIVVAVGSDGKSGTVTFIWDCGRYNRAVHGIPETPVHHAVIEARYPDEDVTVKCKNGRFVGLKNSVTGVCSFKSVPFAKPARRWLPPEDPADSDEIVSARQFGPAAAQTYEPSEYASRGPISEDCLKLTVWTANGFDPNNPNRAVMFFIHGGSYVLGGMCDPLYDGANIVMSNPDVIVVSCDYRLCAFGFLDLNELPGFDPIAHAAYAQAPNLGILDQQAGLRWVKNNIASFGGNPDNVTIFGESAGGGSVSCLLQAKGSENLFKRAIVMSGTVDLTDSAALYKGSNQALLLMKAADKNSFGELLECDTDELINALNVSLTDPRLAGIPHIASREGGSTVADMNNRPMCADVRGIVPSDPFASFATNAVAKDVDVMIGSTSEELNYWAHLMFNVPHSNGPLGYYYDFLSNGVSRTQNIYTQLGYGSEVLEFLRDVSTTHPFDRDERFNLGGRYPEIWGRTELRSELAFRIPSIIMAEQHLKQVEDLGGSGKTYMYYFCRPQVNPAEPWIGACHASELTSVFKNIYLDVDSSNRVELATRVS